MDDNSATIEVIEQQPVAITPGELWQPVLGEEALALLATLPEDARPRIREEARSILARSANPKGSASSRAGLVVGYVQSGKTTSMMAAAAMGRDNGFGLVIFIAGTSDILLGQSRERLEHSLRLGDADAYRRWVHLPSPKPGTEGANRLAAELEDWLGGPHERSTVLVTVMKQHKHLKDLAQVLREAGDHVALNLVPTLLFDDEADQASLNLKSQPGTESATYRDLRLVRAALPWHTLLQYTATPQAILLISIADEISPDFTCVLAPGADYVGGKYFFEDHRGDFVRLIPDVEAEGSDGFEAEPPATLFKALAVFAIGAAVGLTDQAARPTQRSMLVHPSHETFPHGRFAGWVRTAAEQWAVTLQLEETDPDRLDLVKDVFHPAYLDLTSSNPTLPPFMDLLGSVPSLLRKLRIEEVNRARGGSSPSIAWSTGYAWALVGGQLLDRGFTVEGLTVTYMPRGMGVGHADTVQQRARFFGYKRDYAGLCRAWLDPAVAAAFEAYVRHEESVRSGLAAVTRTGQSLRDWKRVFLLDRALKPTRAAVIRLAVERPMFGDDWFSQRYVQAPNTDLNERNRIVVSEFVHRLDLSQDKGHPDRTEAQRHLVGVTKVDLLFEELVSRFAMYEGDLPSYTALQLLIGNLRDQDPNLGCSVYLMNKGDPRERSLRRGVVELMQGANYHDGNMIYPGDRDIRDPAALTVQIHILDVLEAPGGPQLEERVPALAIWVPGSVAADYLVAQ